MSLSHSLAADVLSRTSSNMLNNATESSRACGRAGVIPPFLWFRARPKPPRSGVLDQATLALVPLNLDGYPTPQDPVQRLVSIDVKSGVEKQLATLDPPPDSILAGRISLHPDGNRLAVSFVRQHGKIYMLEGFDESTSWFDRLMRRFWRAATAVVRMVGYPEVGPKRRCVPLAREDNMISHNETLREFLKAKVAVQFENLRRCCGMTKE
jgi:hypothetical protein